MRKIRFVLDNGKYYTEQKIGLFKWYPVWRYKIGIQESFNSKEDAFREYGKCDVISRKHAEPLLALLENFS